MLCVRDGITLREDRAFDCVERSWTIRDQATSSCIVFVDVDVVLDLSIEFSTGLLIDRCTNGQISE